MRSGVRQAALRVRVLALPALQNREAAAGEETRRSIEINAEEATLERKKRETVEEAKTSGLGEMIEEEDAAVRVRARALLRNQARQGLSVAAEVAAVKRARN